MREILITIFILLAGVQVVIAELRYDAIIVRNDIPLDWIIAQAYSHKSGTPIITTSPDRLDENAREQLHGFKEAGWNNVLVFGGEGAISLEIEKELIAFGFITHRISEADRYGTYARVAIELYGTSDGCVMVNGEDYEGLLVAERVATVTGYPMLLIKKNEVPESVYDATTSIGCRKAIVIRGGISDEVVGSLVKNGFDVKTIEGVLNIEDYESVTIKKEYWFLIAGLIAGAVITIGFTRYTSSAKKVPYTLLTEDEEKVIRAISESDDGIKQEALPEITGFSRPKVSRIVSELYNRDLILKEKYKKTYNLKMKKEFY